MRRHLLLFPLALALALVSVASACDDKGGDGPDDKAEGASKSAQEGQGEPDEPDESGEDADASGTKVFSKDDRKQRCKDLSPEFLGELFDFPPEKLDEQRPKEGKHRCNWQWSEGRDELFFAQVGTMWVKKDEEGAKRHYANATASKTQKEIEADMKTIEKEAAKDETLKKPSGKKVTKTATGAFAALTGDEGVTYEDVPGIGDQARISSRDGSVWVRIGNAHLIFTAYRGPGKKPLMNGNMPVTDMKKIMAHERKWIQDTMEQRREASLKLAKAYVPFVEKLAD